MAAKTKAQKIIDDNAVAVFSKSYCPYCKATKSLLSEMGAKYYAIELDQVDDGSAIQSALEEISGQRTVPNVYISQKHIGGNSELQGKKEPAPIYVERGWCFVRTTDDEQEVCRLMNHNTGLRVGGQEGQLPSMLKEAGAL